MILEFESIFRYVAWSKSPEPCQSPPTKIVPPPVLPSAVIVAVLISISLAVTSTEPPFEVSELEFNVPEIVEAPFEPASILISLAVIAPVLVTNLTIPFSDIKPSALAFSILITWSTTDWAISVFKVTIPFWDLIFPSLLIEDFIFEGLTDTVKRLLSLILNFRLSPAARLVATFVLIVPLLVIIGESKATYSPSMLPSFIKVELLLVEKL